VFSELEVNFFLLRRLLGVRSKEGEKQSKVRIPPLGGGGRNAVRSFSVILPNTEHSRREQGSAPNHVFGMTATLLAALVVSEPHLDIAGT